MRNPLAVLRGVARAVRALGVRGVLEREIRRSRDRRDYAHWVAEREGRLAVPATGSGDGPLFSVLMPTHETDPAWLERAVASVRAQTHGPWELCIADDASSRPGLAERLERLAREDPRIRVVRRATRGHISAASNSALALARGEYVALLDHDDELAPTALAEVAAEIGRSPDADVVYSDEDKLDGRGRRVDAYFKPDFSPDLLLSQNVVSHLGVYRTGLVRRAGGFREGLEGAQDHDLALRVLEASSPDRFRHVPRVLYHWRTTRQSTSGGLWRKDYAHDAGCRAIADHLARTGRAARVERSLYSFYRVRYALPDPTPSIAVVALAPHAPGLQDLVGRGAVGLSVELAGVPAGTPASLGARLDGAVRASRAEVVVLLGPRCEPRPGWLEELVSHAVRPEVGVVGGRVLTARGRVLQAGYLLDLGLECPVVDAHRGLPAAAPGHFGRALLVQNLSAVSAACLALRREVYEALGGLDAGAFPDGLFDVDLCLRARERGLRIVFTPHAAVVRPGDEDPSWPRLGTLDARERLRRAWGERLPRDPCWHPEMDRRSGDFRLRL
jgi:GT2 family glycosyltransferase